MTAYVRRLVVILPLLLLCSCLAFCQTAEVIRKSDKKFHLPPNDFAFIEPATDSTRLEFVATIQASGKVSSATIQKLYYAILKQAQEFGANAFKLSSFTRNDSTKEETLALDTYFGDDSILNDNFKNHERCVIYIISSEKTKDNDDTYSFKINDHKKTIRSGTYFRQEIKEGEEIKVNKGGITGMTIWFKWREGSLASFFTLSGLGVGGPMAAGVTGMAFNTGRLNHVQGDLGCLLKSILKQTE